MARVGFLGTGDIATAMVQGLAGRGHDIAVSARNAGRAAQLAAAHGDVSVTDNAEVVARSDVVIACLMASVARDVMPGLPWRADQAVISVMVDVSLADLARLCAPAQDIALSIPLPSIAAGGCPLPVFPDSPALRDLFGADNMILPVASERALNAHFGASALSASVLALLNEGVDWLAQQTGDRAGAEAYVTGVFAGYLRADGSGRHLEALLDSLATPGGLNATLRAQMDDLGAPAALRAGMDGLRPRLGLTAAKAGLPA